MVNCICFFHQTESKLVEFCSNKTVFPGNASALRYLRKSSAEAHRILLETNGDHNTPETICRFRRLKNNDDEKEELEALIDKDSCLMQVKVL